MISSAWDFWVTNIFRRTRRFNDDGRFDWNKWWSAWFWECPISRLNRLWWKWGVKQPCFTEELFILDVDHPVALRWEPKSAVVWLRSSLAKFRGVVCRTLVSQVAGGFTCAMEKNIKADGHQPIYILLHPWCLDSHYGIDNQTIPIIY